MQTPTQRAAELLNRHWSGYPINPWIIADREGLQVRQSYILPERIAGVIARESATSPLIMLVNGKDPRRKQRFTVAHELGHYTRLKEQGRLSCRLGFVEDREDLSILHATKHDREDKPELVTIIDFLLLILALCIMNCCLIFYTYEVNFL